MPRRKAQRRKPNSGSVIEKPRGVFQLRWFVETRDEEGQLQRVQRYKRLREVERDEAEAALRKLIDEVVVDDKKLTLKELLEKHFLDECVNGAEPVRANTLRGYERLIRLQIVPHIGNVRLRDLKPSTFERLYTKLRREGAADGGRLANHTVRKAHNVLHRSLKIACWRGWIAKNPLADFEHIPKPEKKIARATSLAEMEHLEAHASGSKCFRCPADRPDERTREERERHALLASAVALGCFAGLRKSMALAISWGAIDFKRGMVSVTHSLEQAPLGVGMPYSVRLAPTKSGKAESLQLSASALRLLQYAKQTKERLHGPESVRFDRYVISFDKSGDWVSPNRFSKAWKLFITSAGMPDVTFHAGRHGFATEMLRSGARLAEVQRLLGHSDIHLTVDTYGHIGEDDLSRSVDLFDRRREAEALRESSVKEIGA